jgi:predicted membrane metal-binding protein
LVLGALPQNVTPSRLRVALHGGAQESLRQIGDIVQLAAHLSPPPGPAELYGYDFQRQAWFVARSWLENDGRPISQKAAHGAMRILG